MQNYFVGVDIGGTTVKLAIFPEGERAITKWEITTVPEKLYQDLNDTIWAKLEEMGIAKEQLKAVGMGIPGPVAEDGYVSKCVNLGFKECYPERELAEIMKVPVVLGNDANVAALGEVYYGAAKGFDDAVLFTLGTGVGGGIIVRGKIVAGNRGLAGEVGHFIVNPDETDTCGCGGHGCLEQYTSATGIVRVAKKLLAAGKVSKMSEYENIDAKIVCDLAREGDPTAMEVIDTFGKYLGLAAAHAMLTVDPDVIILGGGVSRAGQILIDALEKYLHLYTPIANVKPKVVIATLGNDAGTYGAAAMAMSKFK